MDGVGRVTAEQLEIPLDTLLARALGIGDDGELRAVLIDASGLPGPRLNLELVSDVAGAVGRLVRRPDPPVDGLEALLDGWAAMSGEDAPGDAPAVILPCAAVRSYGEVAAMRPDWWDDELAKLRRAASDGRWRVREMVAMALQRALDADWPRTARALLGWAGDQDPLVARAAAAGVAEPPLLTTDERTGSATDIQRRAVENLGARPAETRRDPAVRVLRKALAFTVSVVTAATGDFTLLQEMAASADPDLRWAAKENLKRARLGRWPERVAEVRQLIERRS